MPRAAALEIAALDKSDFSSALQSVLRRDAEALDVERVNFWRLREDPPSIVCELGYVRHLRAYEHGAAIAQGDHPRYFAALFEEEVLVADDARNDPRTSEFTEGYLEPLGITSMLDVPVWVRGRLAGVLCHEHVGPARRWTPPEQDFAITVAQAVATTLEARDRRLAERAHRRAELLARATAVLTEDLDIEQIPARLVRFAIPELADWCTLDVARDGEHMARVASAHVDPQCQTMLDELTRLYPPHLGTTPSARAHRGGQALLVPVLDDETLVNYCVDADHTRLVRALGSRSLMALPLGARGRLLGAIVFVSAQREYTPEDLQLAEELARRAAIALDNARLHREAKDAIARRDEFLSLAAHELYTPLTSLSLAAAQLSRTVSNGARRSLEVIMRSADRLTHLVDEMLDTARTSSESMTLRREPADLVAIARSALEAVGCTAERAKCVVSIQAPAPVSGQWDVARIEQLVAILLANAMKFGAGRPIEVEITGDERRATLRVRDRGPGIAPQDLERIFERLERAVSRRAYGGLGLGLYIARGIARAHGGRLTATSTLGAGATFTLELPREPS